MKKSRISLLIDKSIINQHHGVRRYLFSLADKLQNEFDISFFNINESLSGVNFEKVIFDSDFIFNNGFNNNVKMKLDNICFDELENNNNKFKCTYLQYGNSLPISDLCIIGAPWVANKINVTNAIRTYCIGYDAIPIIYSLNDHLDMGLKKFAIEHYCGYKKAIEFFDGILSISEHANHEISTIFRTKKIITIPAFLPIGFDNIHDSNINRGKTVILAAPFDTRKGLEKLPSLINNSSIEKVIIFGGIRCTIEEVHSFFQAIKGTHCEWWSSVTTLKQIELYRSANLLIFPSYSEGLGLPVLEALACGTNVVVSDIEPLNKLIDESCILNGIKEHDSNIINIKLESNENLSNKNKATERWGGKIVLDFFSKLMLC